MANHKEIKIMAFKLAKEHNFIVFPTRDKAPRCGGWQNLTEPYTDMEGWRKANGYGIQAGARNGFTVIDVDLPAMPWFLKFRENYGLKETTTVKTPSGGLHLYYKYNKDCKTT